MKGDTFAPELVGVRVRRILPREDGLDAADQIRAGRFSERVTFPHGADRLARSQVAKNQLNHPRRLEFQPGVRLRSSMTASARVSGQSGSSGARASASVKFS